MAPASLRSVPWLPGTRQSARPGASPEGEPAAPREVSPVRERRFAGRREPGWALPDYLAPGLALVIVGFNPGLRSAEVGHYYAHPNNRLWELLHGAGLVPRRLGPEDDALAPNWGIGFTDVVKRASASSSDLTAAELRQGAEALRRKLAHYRPRVVCYNGKGIYRAVAGIPAGADVAYGRQPACVVPGVVDFVAPSPSGRSGLPYRDKLHWYRELRSLLDELGAWGPNREPSGMLGPESRGDTGPRASGGRLAATPPRADEGEYAACGSART
jgi:TDG/mug DNA glycosylase family protein